ncbi:clusterin-associated protein 1 [Aricia agestis]|uniref:clusterin-associated protein 1 n=1 Tax=Aricia agestis TaxID=91739 RepID=UPI001C20C3CC|nr:clusterin-associated protein 1 [Aricia agestis]
MSYRDLRNFSEAMRSLGYPEPVSLDSFRAPNWSGAERALRWLAARVDPDARLPGGSASVEQRVALITGAVELFHTRANLKLNGKRLYGADGWAVRELLKVAGLLRAAAAAPAADRAARDPPLYDVSNRLGEIKQARALATDITAKGAFLYDLLAKEAENKEHRDAALSRPLDMSALEAALNAARAALAERVEEGRAGAVTARGGGAALDAKIERRRAELQRAEKRLHTVQKIKPAYQGEVVLLQAEVAALWERYVLRYRCVEALKHHLSLLEARQAEAAEEQQAAIMQLIHKYEAEDVLGKLSDSDEQDSSEESKEVARPRPATRPKTRLRIKTAGTEGRRAFGSMQARESLDDPDDPDDPDDLDSDLSDHVYGEASGSGAGGGGGGGVSRWGRRAGTRTLAGAAHYDDLIHDLGSEDDEPSLTEAVVVAGAGARAGGAGGAASSLGSSSESELRLSSAPPRADQLSDNEF